MLIRRLVIYNNTPLTPRKRGAEIASLENYTLALNLWRGVCAEAGLAFIKDNCTTNGARKVAARYLDTGDLTPEAVKQAMQKLAHLITHNERASHYTLNALGNNISRYVTVRKQESAPQDSPCVRWYFACTECSTTAGGRFPVGTLPRSIPCSRQGCSGMLIPTKGDENHE